eukprot:g3802.t1
MDALLELEPENETIFSYRFRKHNDDAAKTKLQSMRGKSQIINWLNTIGTSLVYVIHPFSTFKQFWDRLIFLLVIFNSMAIPWLLAFKLNKGCNEANDELEDSCVSNFERFIAIAMDVIFWIDMVLSMRCGFVDKNMVIRMNDREVLYHYFTRHFLIDFIANFPYYTIAQSTVRCTRIQDGWVDLDSTREGSFEGRIAMNLYILPKLLRTVRAFRSPGETNFSPTISRILKMVGSFLIASHWCGCVWYFIGRWEVETFGANTFTGNVSWIEVSKLYSAVSLNDDGHSTYLTADLRTKYTAAVYWAITTMSTVGYGDIVPQTNIERVFTMVVQFIGATSAALILGHVAVLIANFNNSSQEFRDKRYILDAYLKSNELPLELCKRARASLQHSWNLHRGMDQNTMLRDLPPNMEIDILELILTNEIQNTYLFEDCDRLFIRALVAKLRPEMYTPGEVVYHKDDLATSMYFIRSGKVKVIESETGLVVDVLSEGTLFGETELFDKLRRLNTIEALTSIELQRLGIDDMNKLMSDFPEYKSRLHELSHKMRHSLKAKLCFESGTRAPNTSYKVNEYCCVY